MGQGSENGDGMEGSENGDGMEGTENGDGWRRVRMVMGQGSENGDGTEENENGDRTDGSKNGSKNDRMDSGWIVMERIVTVMIMRTQIQMDFQCSQKMLESFQT